MKILIAIDGSSCSQYALQEACRLLPVAGAEAKVVTVLDPLIYATGYEGFAPGAQVVLEREERSLAAELEKARAYLAERGAAAIAVEVEGDVADRILEEAQSFQPDVIVMGSHGRSAVGRLVLGSVSDRVLHAWPGAVLIIRPRAA